MNDTLSPAAPVPTTVKTHGLSAFATLPGLSHVEPATSSSVNSSNGNADFFRTDYGQQLLDREREWHATANGTPPPQLMSKTQ